MTRFPTPPLLAALALSLLGACAATEPSVPWDDAAGDVADPALAQLCRDGWEDHLAWNPISATNLGDPRHHGELVLPSPENRERCRTDVAALLERARSIAPGSLSASDRITLELLVERWSLQLAELEDSLELDAWNLDPLEAELELVTIRPRRTDVEVRSVGLLWLGE